MRLGLRLHGRHVPMAPIYGGKRERECLAIAVAHSIYVSRHHTRCKPAASDQAENVFLASWSFASEARWRLLSATRLQLEFGIWCATCTGTARSGPELPSVHARLTSDVCCRFRARCCTLASKSCEEFEVHATHAGIRSPLRRCAACSSAILAYPLRGHPVLHWIRVCPPTARLGSADA